LLSNTAGLAQLIQVGILLKGKITHLTAFTAILLMYLSRSWFSQQNSLS